MQAADLQQMLRAFDPGRSLPDEELDSCFVERPDSPRQRLRLLLEAGDKPQKILFAGHRGSGKTAELRKPAAETPDLQTLHIDAVRIVGRTSLITEDLILAIFDGLFSEATKRELGSTDSAEAAHQALTERLDDLSRNKLGTRRLIALLNEAPWVTLLATQSPLLLVIEGLDKIDPTLARDLLRDNAAMLTAIEASMIFVVPAVLRHFADFQQIRGNFDDFQLLANLPIHRRDGSIDAETHRNLSRLVLARAEKGLIEPEALDLLLRMNGGLPRRLVELIRGAALHAMARDAHQISRRDAESAVGELRRDLGSSLDGEDYEILRARHADHRVIAGPREIRLFTHGSLIEYPDDVPWCDAHPLLWPMLEEQNGVAAAPWEPAAERREAPSSPAEVYIRSMVLKDVKGIRQARLELAETVAGAPGWYVFAGGNGAGKSTLLRSLALAMPGRWPARLVDGSWVRNGAKAASTAVALLAPEQEAELGCSLKIRRDGELDSGCDEATEDLLGQSWFLAGYGPFKRLEGGSDHARDLARSDPRLGRVVTLFLEEASLAEVPKWLFRTGFHRRSLTRSLLDLLNSGLMPEGFRAETVVEEDLVLATPDGPAMPLRRTSDGPRSIVAMILDILRGLEDCHGSLDIEGQQVLNPGVVLIDEPDNHLHIHWQLGLGSWLKEHFPRIQFIVATHSPFLCAAADRIWRLDDEEGRIAPRALSDEEMRQVQAGSVTTILESDAFRIFNTLPVEARERHEEFLDLRRLSLQGQNLSSAQQTRLAELEQEFFGPKAPRDPEFEALFPDR